MFLVLRFLLSVTGKESLAYVLLGLLDPVLPGQFHRVSERLLLENSFELRVKVANL